MISALPLQYVPQSDADAEIANAVKPPAFEPQIGYPYTILTDRQFECLLHDLYEADIAEKKVADRYDEVLLMLGVSERGRDCALLKQGKHVGVIQCKRYEAPLQWPESVREIVKFVLHSIADSRLMPDPNGFRYILATASGFNQKATDCLADFSTSLDNEPKLDGWIEEVITENKSLSHFKLVDVRSDLMQRLHTIKVEPIKANDLDTKMVGRTIVIAKYFTIKKVFSEEGLEEVKGMIKTVLDAVTDKEVSLLAEKLQKIPADRRFDIGLMSLWGYPKVFLESLVASSKLVELSKEVAVAKSAFERSFMEYLFERVQDEIYKRVTLLGLVSPFSIQAAAPYVWGKLSKELRQKFSGKLMANFGTPSLAADTVSIRKKLLEVGEAVLRNDFSGFFCEGELLALKINLARHVHQGFNTVKELEEQFDKDWPKLEPILDHIVKDMVDLIPDPGVIVVGGPQWLDDASQLEKVMRTLSGLGRKKK